MIECYECEKEVIELVWNSRCQECFDRRVTFNKKCIEDNIHVGSATEELVELLKPTNSHGITNHLNHRLMSKRISI